MMPPKFPVVNETTCAEVVEDVLREAAHGVQLPKAGGEARVAQLDRCLTGHCISQKQYELALDAIRARNTKAS
jgi:hypothetical protein